MQITPPLQPGVLPGQPSRHRLIRDAVDPQAFYLWGLFDDQGNLEWFGVEDLRVDEDSIMEVPPLDAGVHRLEAVALGPRGAIVGLPVSVDIIVGDQPFRVELVRAARDDTLDDALCPSFAGFTVEIENRFGGLISQTPPFGLGSVEYEALLIAARAYVQACECADLRDLAPQGYVTDRGLQQPGWVPDPADPLRQGLPCLELIWSYWQEEGMLVQTLNHIVARFQNRRVWSGDPLARFDVSPLVPLRSLLWSWVENEQRRLTVRRRAAEYEYEYGLTLIGKAVPRAEAYVERRSGFLRSFHTVLHLATVFFKERDDLTVNPDGFPLYEALRECHIVLSQGSQNQYGEMAVAARAEMLVMQQILAQAPMREFLGGRPMTPYPEPWMDRVDSMKSIQGWTDVSTLHFHDLATFGERLVITIRLGNWNATSVGATDAADWATAFRPVIQRYIAAYRAVTGVDLSTGIDATMPSTHLARRVGDGRRRA